MSRNLPKKPRRDDSKADGEERSVTIDTFHYHGNDLRELTILARENPELAERIVKQQESFDIRHHGSYRFGLVATVALVVAVLFAVAYLMVNVGIWSTVGAVGIILAVALLIRVVLTGQWSETTWVGKVLQSLASALGGGKPPKD